MFHRLVEIKKQVGKFIANFSVTSEDGKEYIFDGEIIREGLDISTYDDKGDVVPLGDGEYTIKGVKVKIVNGKVAELIDKVSKLEKPDDTQKDDKKTDTEPVKEDERVAELMSQVERLKSENEALKAELKTLKETPLAKPVPQRTNMASQVREVEISENIKGTRFEKACRILGS